MMFEGDLLLSMLSKAVSVDKKLQELGLHGKEPEKEREHLNIVFIGHVDAGKSTIAGQLLLLTGQIDERTIQKYQKEAVENGRESWYLAYIMDTNEEERQKGKTVDVGKAQFSTAHKRYTILDAPGHKSYVKNMIGGAAQADVAVLVISARQNEFEAGFDRGGQTREHAILSKTIGVSRIIVLVNKMDDKTVNWSQKRYDEIQGKLNPFFKKLNITDVIYCPCSGLTGANLKAESVEKDNNASRSWYKGATFLSILDSIKPMDRNPQKPVRIPVSGKSKELGHLYVTGKVEYGTITKGQKLLLEPSHLEVDVQQILVDEKDALSAATGENVTVKIKGAEEDDVRIGQVLCSKETPVKCTKTIEAEIQVLELPAEKPILSAGSIGVAHVHTLTTECTITKILSLSETKITSATTTTTTTNLAEKPKPKKVRFLKAGEKGTVVIETSEMISAECFADFPQLGRLTLRDKDRTIAVGKILKACGIPA